MDNINQEIEKIYGHRLRLRVCGLLVEEQRVLLLSHQGIGKGGYMWAPPGGGIEFGEQADQALKREFLEETGLHIRIVQFLYVHEYLQSPLHAIELIFLVERLAGSPKLGNDPEMKQDNQILSELVFMDQQRVFDMEAKYLHHVFGLVNDLESLKNVSGYYLSD